MAKLTFSGPTREADAESARAAAVLAGDPAHVHVIPAEQIIRVYTGADVVTFDPGKESVALTATISDGGVGILGGEAGGALPSKFLSNLSLSAFPPVEKIIIIGASHEALSFGDASKVSAAVSRVQAATGKTVAIESYAVSGHTTAQARAVQWTAALAANAATQRNGRVMVIIACGGNDITPLVPIDSASDYAALDAAVENIEWIIAQVEAQGWDWHLQDLSWRDYNPPACRVNRNAGSWPFVERVDRAITARRYAGYQVRRHPDGSAWGNVYAWMRNNRHLLSGDGIHPSDPDGITAYRNFVCDNVIIPAVMGVRPAVIVPRDETYPITLNVTVNVVESSVTPTVTSSHQGTAYAVLADRGATLTAAQIIAGTGGIAACNLSVTGQYIDTPRAMPTLTGAGGTYDLMTVFVADTTQQSDIGRVPVSATAAPRTLMVFGSATATTSVAGANLLKHDSTPGKTWSGLLDTTGAASPIVVSTPSPFDTSSENGVAGLSALPLFPAGSGTGSWIIGATLSAAVRIDGLTAGGVYQIAAAGVRADASDAGNRITYLNANGVSGSYNASQAASGGVLPSAALNNVVADANGRITMTVSRGSDVSYFAYLGALSVQRTG